MWRSLIFADVAGIREHASSMNAARAPELFASVLTLNSWDNVSSGRLHVRRAQHLEEVRLGAPAEAARGSRGCALAWHGKRRRGCGSGGPGCIAACWSAQDRKRAQSFAHANRDSLTELLASLPRPLLLLLKTNDCLRSVDRMLGVDPGASSIPATARACDRLLAMQSGTGLPRWRAKLAGLWRRVRLEVRLLAVRAYSR